MANGYTLWRQELVASTAEADRAQRTTKPDDMLGFWRMVTTAKMKPDWPVAIWKEPDPTVNPNGAVIFQVGRKVMRTDTHATEWQDFVESGWLKCVAVVQGHWAGALEEGRWQDGKQARNMDESERLGIDVKPGDNQAPIEELLADQIATLVDKAKATPEPTTQDEADAATGLLDKLRALLKRAEAERVVEKEPHLQASRDVDAKWSRITTPGKEEGAALDARRKEFLRKEQRRLDDIAAAERAKREAEARAIAQAERERLQKEADERTRQENERRRAEAQPEVAPEIVPEVAIVAEPVIAERATAGTAYGRASGLKKVKVAVVKDIRALAEHFIHSGDVDFAAYLQTRAAAALRGKVILPGVEARDELK